MLSGRIVQCAVIRVGQFFKGEMFPQLQPPSPLKPPPPPLLKPPLPKQRDKRLCV